MGWSSVAFSPRGRINRKPFWIISIVINVINSSTEWVETLIDKGAATAGFSWTTDSIVYQGLEFVLALGVFYVSIVVGIKRYHDRNKSGYWLLLVLVPIVGIIWVFIETGFLRGTQGPNDYGPDPLAPGDAIVGVFDAPPITKAGS